MPRARERQEPATFRNFQGLDLRNIASGGNPLAWREATNVHLTPGKGAEVRDPVKLFAKVAAESHGLYVVNDSLRCALPYPALASGPVPRFPSGITYDLLVDQDNKGMPAGIEAVESVTAWDNRPYICARVTVPGGVKFRHYFIPDGQAIFAGSATAQAGNDVTIAGLPAQVGVGATISFFAVTQLFQVTARAGDVVTLSPALPVLASPDAMCTVFWPVKNYVKVPFEPGPAVVTAGEKVFAPDVLGRNVWFCSTEFGPVNWTAVDDAGFLPTSRQVDGDQPIRGLGVYRGQLTVFFETVAQTWTVDADPANMAFNENVGGAGTLYPDSVANVSGDLFYFSNGAFRSLDAQVLTGQPKEGDIGAPIRELTAVQDPDAVSAWWSAWRQQYICAFDNIVYIFTFSPASQTYGWGRWVLPWPVSALVEWRGRLFVRRADQPEVWVFDPDAANMVEWSLSFNFSDLGNAGTVKMTRFFEAHQEGTATFSLGLDPDDDTAVEEMATVTGDTGSSGRVTIMAMAESFQPIFRGFGYWRLDEFRIRFQQGGLL